MLWVLGSLAYASVALGAARLLAGHLAWTWRQTEWERDRERYPSLYSGAKLGRPNGGQWFGAWCVACALVLIWPLLIVPWLVGRRTAAGAELVARKRSAEARVRELEKELGL